MPEFSGWNILGEVLLLVGSAVAMGVVLEAVGISAIIGYLLAGVLLGPSRGDKDILARTLPVRRSGKDEREKDSVCRPLPC